MGFEIKWSINCKLIDADEKAELERKNAKIELMLSERDKARHRRAFIKNFMTKRWLYSEEWDGFSDVLDTLMNGEHRICAEDVKTKDLPLEMEVMMREALCEWRAHRRRWHRHLKRKSPKNNMKIFVFKDGDASIEIDDNGHV